MGKRIDFFVDWNADQSAMCHDIIRHITLNRNRFKKPVIILFTGDSGEGKSYAALKVMESILPEGVTLVDVIEKVVAYTPLEYSQTINYVLFEAKHLNVVLIDEAREVISAQLWHEFINRAISDVNALSRSVKPLVVLVVTQFIKDIDIKIRRTITFYAKCYRPLGGNTRMRLYRIWKDDYDLENPRLRKRPLTGYIKKDGRYHKFITGDIVLKKPEKEATKIYERLNREKKTRLIRAKLDKILHQLEHEFEGEFKRVEQVAEWYASHRDVLRLILKRSRGKVTVDPEVKVLWNMNPSEFQEFEKRIVNKLSNMNLAKEDEDEAEKAPAAGIKLLG